jgi:hypothetical protein
MGVSLVNMLGLSSSVRVAHIACYWKFLFVHYISSGFAKRIMSILLILCYNGSLVVWTVVSLGAAKFMPLMFSTSGFALFYATNMFILMLLYDFLLPAQFCYIIVYIRKSNKPCANRGLAWTCAHYVIFIGKCRDWNTDRSTGSTALLDRMRSGLGRVHQLDWGMQGLYEAIRGDPWYGWNNITCPIFAVILEGDCSKWLLCFKNCV